MSIFPLLGVPALLGLLYGEWREDRRLVWLFKPMASVLFILTALAGSPADAYDWVVVVGLVLCLLGDVFLIPDSPRWFLAGLVAFLSGHVAYIVAFNGLVLVTALNPLALAVITALSLGLFLWFRPHLGRMLGPVVAYIVVITLMVMSAWAVFFETGAPQTFRLLVALGATAFYFSDVSVARARFMAAGRFNRMWGLPLYYLGQFLLALSVGRV